MKDKASNSNPVIHRSIYKGWIIRYYKDGFIDAGDGKGIGLTPGFYELGNLLEYIEEEEKKT